MGNTESSSEFPEDEDYSMQRAKKPSTEEDPQDKQSSTIGMVLKAGVAVAGTALIGLGWRVAGTALLALGACSIASSFTSSDSGGRSKENSVPDGVGVRGSSTAGYMAEAYQSPTSSDSGGRRKSIVNSVPDGVGVRGSSTTGYMAEAYQPHRLRPSNHMGEGNQYNGSRLIKIMSYNVWFCKDVEVHERMRAIGHLILKYSPEIIFFQEVTPNIYGIFQCSSWWQEYNCSVLPEKANRRCFCILLSKLPVKKFSRKRLDNSKEKELCIADVNVGSGKKLLVATSHFKSPTPSNMHSMERVAQARDALSFLKRFRNVVFGGDLNWVDSSDGSFPLYGKWIDAWAHLRPGESGWTFDTISNTMLGERKLLQERLDRFICKLKDFKVIKIDMVGTEAIKGLYYVNERMMTLPVLPSDHYGLLLTIQSN